MKLLEIDPGQTVLVIGGRGFIGRSIVDQLENVGASVLIGSRCTKPTWQAGTRKILLHKLRSEQQCDELLAGIDVVVNAVGILRPRRGECYEQVHHHAVASLANACARKNIRFVHISALGLSNPVASRFLQSKLRGEQAVQACGGDWYICRPSIVDGAGGYGAKWFRKVAAWPIHFAPANATGRLAPINVSDLGEAVARIALQTRAPAADVNRVYELGGGKTMSVFEYLSVLSTRAKTPTLQIPAGLARLASHILDLLHLTPFSFGHYELLKYDNCPKANQASELLGRPCTPVGYSSANNLNGVSQTWEAVSNER